MRSLLPSLLLLFYFTGCDKQLKPPLHRWGDTQLWWKLPRLLSSDAMKGTGTQVLQGYAPGCGMWWQKRFAAAGLEPRGWKMSTLFQRGTDGEGGNHSSHIPPVRGRELSDFADYPKPLRYSALPKLGRCTNYSILCATVIPQAQAWWRIRLVICHWHRREELPKQFADRTKHERSRLP